ncbi:MAG: CsiV family protein [Neptuniibacter sp.]
MNKWIQTLFLSFFIALTTQVHAEDWFTVEVIIFANNGSENLDDEYWQEINAIPERASITLAPPAANDEELNAFQQLPGNLLSLHQEISRLVRSSKYRVLYHKGWMQPVSETQNPKPVRIQGGNILDNGMFELDGYIAVGRGRYLHFRPDLYFSRTLTADESQFLKKKQPSTEPSPLENEATIPNAASNATLAMQPIELFIPDTLTVNLKQARRMRSKELHFIDHPLFGVLVEIKPVK